METKYYEVYVDQFGERHVRAIRVPKKRSPRRSGWRQVATALAAALVTLLLISLITGAAAEEREEPIVMTMSTAPLLALEWQQLPPSRPVQREPQPAAEPAPAHPFAADEIALMAQTIFAEANILSERDMGVSVQARQAAVGWCILNRLDEGSFGDTLAEVITAPAQFAWSPDAPVVDTLLALAEDVCTRWYAERLGEATPETSGRTLPARYIFFGGENGENWFRTEYDDWSDVWDWDCVDPY